MTSPLEKQNTTETLLENPHDISAKSVAIIGDSLSVGISQSGFNKKETEVIAKTGAHLNQIEAQLGKVDPQKTPNLIIQGGTNDLVPDNYDAKTIARKLIEIYKQALKMGFRSITLLTIPPQGKYNGKDFGKRGEETNIELKKLALAENVNLFDIHSAIKTNPNYKTDGLHPTPQSYKKLGELILTELKNQKSSIISDAIETQAQILLTEELSSQNDQENLQSSLSSEISKLDKKDNESTLQKLGGEEGVKKIRFTTVFEEKIDTEKPQELRKALRTETSKRVNAYSTVEKDNKGEWFVLNYQNINEDHEFNIGLGDILIDPSITDVMVHRRHGGRDEYIRATRGVVAEGKPHAGRLGFIDEDGNYVWTRTGDRFKILTSQKAQLKAPEGTDPDKKFNQDEIFILRFKKEQEIRDKNKENFSISYSNDVDIISPVLPEELKKIKIQEDQDVVTQIIKGLSPMQRSSARIIESEFSKAGFSKSIIAAAIVNAHEESGLNPNSSNTNGEVSIGLFQLNSNGGLGSGMSIAERKDPIRNCRRMIQAAQGKQGARLRKKAAEGASIPELTAIFCEDLERPANRFAKGKQRAQVAATFFPKIEDSDTAVV